MSSLLGLLVRLWLGTLRLRVEVDPAVDLDARLVLVFFHGTQFPLLAWKRPHRTAVLVSHSADGDIQSRVLGGLGFSVVRGSSSRGGARALAAIVRRMKRGEDAAFAVDGPRGPYGVVKPGAALAARAGGAVLVPIGSAITCGHVLARAWDRFAIPWPFTRVAVAVGAPIPGDVGDVAERIAAANARAAAMLARDARAGVRALGSR